MQFKEMFISSSRSYGDWNPLINGMIFFEESVTIYTRYSLHFCADFLQTSPIYITSSVQFVFPQIDRKEYIKSGKSVHSYISLNY